MPRLSIRAGLILALPFVLVALASWTERQTQNAVAAGGLVNPGFESGVLGGFPASWAVTQPVPDVVKVVGTEGPANFATYADMGNVTIVPNKGTQMLRLGTPKRIAESQNRGTNAVSQTFTATQTSLKFSFRLFSWEHRGNDLFRFDLKSGNKSVGTIAQLVVPMPDGSTRTCSSIPCQFSIDVGSRGQYLDSGWRVVEITGVPTGTPLTLIYGAGGTNDQAHATWAYFDNVNSPPVSLFGFSPAQPREGSQIQFSDRSYDPDPEDHIVAWQWDIDGELSTQRNPFTILPDERTYVATLIVTSSDGLSTRVVSGENALDGTAVPPLIVSNAAPVLNALNVETLSTQDAPLTGRFADTGWLDTHSNATWSIGSNTPAATVVEDNLPALSTGLVTGSIRTAASTAGSLTVRDNDGGVSTSNFQISVVPENSQRFEPANDIATAPVLASGGSYLSYIQSLGDVDIFEVKLPNGQLLPAGSEVLASLLSLPADYDLVLLTQVPSGPPVSRYAQGGVGLAAFDDARYAQGRYAQGRYAQGRYAQGRYAQGGFGLAQIPLSAMGFTGLVANEIGGKDISLDELGLGNIGTTNIQVAGFSANRGLTNEHALARLDVPGTRVFAAVFGANGERSATAPYRLQLESSSPPDLATALGPEVCTGTPLVVAGATSSASVLYTNPGTVHTLFVTQRERMRALYPTDDWNALQSDLVTLAQHPSVSGEIVSLPSSIYDDWDRNPCSVDAANAVAASIFNDTTLKPLLSSVDYVVFVGDDDIVPYKRVPDETVISNERDYALDSFLKPGSPLLSSILQGYNLTDDYYVDAAPTTWQGRQLYIPDRAASRLVEKPTEIRGQISAFLTSQGILNPQTGFASGYDFFGDGAQSTADALATKLQTQTLINDTWSANDLRCKFLGMPFNGSTGCGVPDVSAVNAHYTHYGALSAGGFAAHNFNDVLSSDDVANAGGANPALLRRIIFTMGCHAGLSVPDRAAQAPDAGVGINPALDMPQAMALQRAIYIASTGFGLGDDEGIGGTEKLLLQFSQQLVAGQVNAGQALVAAKQQFIASLSAMTVYDEKSTIQTVFYGLPMYRVVPGTASAPVARLSGASTPAGSTSVTLNDGGTSTTTTASVSQVTVPSGSYFAANGESQATAGRAIEPRMTAPLPASAAGPVHGALLRAGSFSDIAGFDPVITRPTDDWETDTAEAQTCLPSFWPAELGSVNTLDTNGALQQTFVGIPGQFRCTSGSAQTVTGVQRNFSAMTFELLRCPSADTVPPAVKTIDLRTLPGGSVGITLDVSDQSGIARIIVLRFAGGAITTTELNLPQPLPLTGKFNLTIPNVGPTDNLVAQVQDGACNVTTATGKGAFMTAIPVDAGPDLIVPLGGASNVFTAKIARWASLVAPVSYDWDFGDGTFFSGVVSPSSIDGAGTATFTVPHTFAAGTQTPLTAKIRILDAAGGIGVDDLIVRSDALGDAPLADADFVGSGTSNDATTMTIAIRVAGVISGKVQYRLTLDVGTAEFKMRYDGGNLSGPPSLRASVNGGELLLTFSLSDVGAHRGDVVRWFVEAQSGVPGAPSSGFPDDMPDTGFLAYTVQ